MSIALQKAQQKIDQKAIVRRYFEEVLDERKVDILDELVTTDCIVHRPEAPEPIAGIEAFRQALQRILEVYSQFTTGRRLESGAIWMPDQVRHDKLFNCRNNILEKCAGQGEDRIRDALICRIVSQEWDKRDCGADKIDEKE